MPFTNAELRDIYTDLNIGSPGPAVDQAAVDAIAAQTRAGLISDQQALQAVFDLVDDTTGVAALTYQFFTGSLPTEGGFQFLVNSPTNANDLNDPYYAQFNAENRFINFSFNLALGTPANQAAFAAVYGAASLEDTIRVAYDTIVGNAAAEAAGIDVEEAIDFLTGPDQVAFYRAIATSRGGVAATDTVRLDLAIKAIAIAELLYAAAQADVGNYASGLNQFYASLIDGTAGSPGFGNDLLETFPPTATVTLTEFADTLTGNVFNAPRGFTPGGTDQVNTLNDDDILTGVGDNPTLNFTFVNDADTGDADITPTLNGIETVNVAVRLDSDGTLDLQDATGVTNVNIDGVDDGNDFLIDNIQSVVDGSISDSNAPSSVVDFSFDEDAVEGDADASTLTLDEVELESIFYQEEGGVVVDTGIEDLTIALEGENDVDNIYVEDAEIITLTGEGSLDLGAEDNVRNSKGNIEATVRSGGFQNVAGSLVEIDASGMTGDLSINLGEEVVANLDDTSGVPVDFVFKGGAGDDEVWLLGGVDSSKDKIDTGAGDDTIGVYASVTKGTITNAESLLVHSGVLGLSPAITVDTGLFTGLQDVTVRNIAHDVDGGDPDADLDNLDVDTTVTLSKLSAAVAEEITVQH
ncbi:MAG TPA: hypothetical protein VEA60_12935, partial [Allosphingosinicella sp.]|nr:hypothetical protein [Allosphingosinicella sp.]